LPLKLLAVSEVVLSRSHYKKEDERICVIAENLLKYSDNKLFLFELIRSLCWDERTTVPQITLMFENGQLSF
jgi:hypothetical protein